MSESTIQIKVSLDEQKMPQRIAWKTSEQELEEESKAMLLALWDSKQKDTYKIDLWTTSMPKEEMIRFFQQTLISMADTLQKAVGCIKTAEELRTHGKSIYERILKELEEQEDARKNSH